MLGQFGPYELILVAAILIIYAIVAYQVFRDSRRGLSTFTAVLWVLIVILLFPLGLLLYLAFALGKRKQTISEGG